MLWTGEDIPPYDSRRHITAGEIRGLGFYVGENVPDAAYVRRVAVDLIPDEDLDDGSTRLGLYTLEPFMCHPAVLEAEVFACRA